ncbi:MAG: type II toxin-antitoxin system RelB/DinJ family antitoxin [Desulfovibrio sp.]|jgi:DNA-damage-inducible protein J|nr:type II toxin-antitoxin system RelB/DinJ family antitoxin [Desulfovibrio sp.]
MLHVRVDNTIKAEATQTLSNFGLTVSDAVRILLTRVVKEGQLPQGLVMDSEAYDTWIRAKVEEALNDTRPTIPHKQVMNEVQAVIEAKRHAGS